MFQQLGCMEAYNLDGGGSSTMYFMGRVVNNPLGRNKERGTSDILFIRADA
jgi:exopolysaccharide biosynthesis protein